jgi:hypothetical protein
MLSWASVHIRSADDIGRPQVTHTSEGDEVVIPIGEGSPVLLHLKGPAIARLRDVLEELLSEPAR